MVNEPIETYNEKRSSFLFWWFGGGVIPVLIPNTAVKPASADGTPQGGE